MKFSGHFYAILGLTTILSLGSFASSSKKAAPAAAPASSMVLVTNTTANPVPTLAQGTTQVAGTVAVSGAVALANGTTVGLANGTTVNLPYNNNNPLSTRESSAGRQTVEQHTSFQVTPGNLSSGSVVYTVPYNKRLIVTSVYGQCQTPIGVGVAFCSLGVQGSEAYLIQIPFDKQGTDPSFENWSAYQQMNIIVKPSDAVTLQGGRGDSGASNTYFNMGFYGYLEDI